VGGRSTDETHDLSYDQLRELILQGVRCSWLPEEKQQLLEEELQNDPSW
jgi:hypothetical protein